MLKNLGMLLLVVGIGIAGVFAAKVTPDVEAQMVRKHKAALAGKVAGAAHKAYCEGLAEAIKAESSDALTELSLNDDCTKKEAPENEETTGDEKVETVIPSYVGVWRRNVSPWDKDAESDVDTFLELMPTGKAVLHEVAKVGDARSIRAQGPYTLRNGYITVSLCGVGKYIDIGCSASSFELNRDRLKITSSKIATGDLDRRRDVQFVLLERTEHQVRKYTYLQEESANYLKVKEAGEKVALSDELKTARQKWLGRKATAIEAAGEKAGETGPTPAGLRFTRWFGENGPGFLVGLLVIIIGALTSRHAIRQEVLSGQGGENEGGGAVDFGEMLQEVRLSVAAHAEEMKTIHEATPADHQRIVDFIDHTKLKKIELMVEARMLLEVKYGVAGYASVFGPFSRAERYLNRSWAALVDYHWPEAQASMETASGAFADAKDALDALISSANGQEPVA